MHLRSNLLGWRLPPPPASNHGRHQGSCRAARSLLLWGSRSSGRPWGRPGEGRTVAPPPPLPNRLRVLRIMAVRVEAEAMAESRFATQVVLRNVCDEIDETPVHHVALPQHLGQREASLPLGLPGIERVDAAVHRGISRRFFAREDEGQMLQSLFFPRRHVRNDVSDRPHARDAGVQQLGLSQTGVRLLERPPGFVKPPQKLLSPIHTSSLRAFHRPSSAVAPECPGGRPAGAARQPVGSSSGTSGACTASPASPSATFVAPQTPAAAARSPPMT